MKKTSSPKSRDTVPLINFWNTVSLSDGDFLIGPCRSQRLGQRQEARTEQGGSRVQRNHQGEDRAQGLSSEYKGLQPFSLERQVRKYRVQLSPPPLHLSTPPSLSGQPGQEPTTPLHRATPSPRKLSSRIDLGENLVLASKSGSEIMVRAQDDRMKHFWPNGISLRGQAAELESSAG